MTNTSSLNDKIDVQLPKTLQEALDISKVQNLDLLISELDYKIASNLISKKLNSHHLLQLTTQNLRIVI